MDQEILDARAKLAARFGKSHQQIGGKGTQRRVKQPVAKQTVSENKKLKSAIKKYSKYNSSDFNRSSTSL